MTPPLSDADLVALEAHPDPKVTALASELRMVRELLVRVYSYVDDVPGTEELQAELEREVARIRAAGR